MSLDFTVEPIDEKPRKKGRDRRGSKYEPIITAFLESGHKLVRVDGTGLDGNYLRMQLVRVIKKNSIDLIEVSVINNEVYLEKM